MRRIRTTLLVVTLLAAACTGTTAAPSAVPTDEDTLDARQDAADPGHARSTDAPAATEPGAVTATTLEQLRSIDPDAHAHEHDHEHAGQPGGDRSGHARHGHGGHAAAAGDEDHHDLFDLPNGVTPERLVIPAIGVDADVIDLGLAPSGEVEVPSDFAQTGWFDETPQPGRVGVSVITGHVDSRTGPAVFFRLAELSPGDRIEVHGVDGAVVEFEMRRAEQHRKTAFPVEEVFRASDRPELVLVTCGGVFDADERSYRDNIIVTAERVDG